MNLHEYQAKALFRQQGLPVPDGYVCKNARELEDALGKLGSFPVILKAQIHAGGRGKVGGVVRATTAKDAWVLFEKMLNLPLKTAQTGGREKVVHTILVERAIPLGREFYLAVTLDRAQAMPVLLFSPEGGMEIEEPDKKGREKIFKTHFLPGVKPVTAKLFEKARIPKPLQRKLDPIMAKLTKLFVEVDASLVEVNPLVVLKNEELVCLDAKVTLDDNGLFRHPDLAAWRDLSEEDPREVEAKQFDQSYVGLSGTIGCMVNGAGLAMATMDIIKFFGGEPANFLDVGGAATTEKVAAAFRIIMRDHNVRAILINIFGGIVRCDLVAQGILDAVAAEKLNMPLVVRLEGTNVAEGKSLLARSGLSIIAVDTFEEAGRKAVEAASGGARK